MYVYICMLNPSIYIKLRNLFLALNLYTAWMNVFDLGSLLLVLCLIISLYPSSTLFVLQFQK